MSGNIHVILNPVAGGGKASKLAHQLLPELEKNTGKTGSLHTTSHQGDATRLVRQLLKENANLIISVGGDGTIHEIINGFFENKRPVNPSCEVAMIPCGTGEDLAKTLKLPASFEEQMKLIASPKYSLLDVGHVTFNNSQGEKEERYFLNECQSGIGGSVIKGVCNAHKFFGGKLGFGSVTLKHAFFYKARPINVQVDNDSSCSSKLYGVVVGNGSYCGGGMNLTPYARPDDGMFDLLQIKKMNLLKRLIGFSKTYSGQHIKFPAFELSKGQHISIDAQEPLFIEADGELLGSTPCEIELLPSVLRVKC